MIKKDIQESIDDIIGILNSDNNKFKEDVIKEFRKNDFLNGSKCKINENNDIDEKSQKHLNESYHNCSFNNSSFMGRIRYMQFKPIYDDITQLANKIYEDKGYYFRFYSGELKLIKILLEENGFKETNHNNWTLFWSTGPIKFDIYNSLTPYQKVNHFPKSYEITRKDYMYRNISKMQSMFGYKNFNFVPKTFILPGDLSILKEDFEKRESHLYIVKPAASSQGRGIYLTDNIAEILSKQNNNMIVCHYIDDPFLINGFKFDLRIYVVITSINPLRIYMYEEGLVRFATMTYDLNDITSKDNRFIHLTNYSVNKYNDNFVVNTNPNEDGSGSKWSISAFKTYLQSQNINTDVIFERIEEILVKTVLSIENTIASAFEMQVPYRNSCFELLGFDVLLDSHLKPWLLEVNLSPSLNIDSPLDQKIKGELISDIFTLIGVVPNDQRIYQNLPINKGFHYGPVNPEKKGEWSDHWNGNNFEKDSKDYNKDEKLVIKETEEEFQRKRNFKRIYPDHNSLRYKSYFEVNRPYNELLRNKETEKIKKGTVPHYVNKRK